MMSGDIDGTGAHGGEVVGTGQGSARVHRHDGGTETQLARLPPAIERQQRAERLATLLDVLDAHDGRCPMIRTRTRA